MGINTRFEKADAATADSLAVTYTANSLTGANAITVADGNVPTVAELGQWCENLTDIVNELIADNASLRAALNAGE
jgi:hypothetical protein